MHSVKSIVGLLVGIFICISSYISDITHRFLGRVATGSDGKKQDENGKIVEDFIHMLIMFEVF
jgi:hypothetical protein